MIIRTVRLYAVCLNVPHYYSLDDEIDVSVCFLTITQCLRIHSHVSSHARHIIHKPRRLGVRARSRGKNVVRLKDLKENMCQGDQRNIACIPCGLRTLG